jgi:hypothetical protein
MMDPFRITIGGGAPAAAAYRCLVSGISDPASIIHRLPERRFRGREYTAKGVEAMSERNEQDRAPWTKEEMAAFGQALVTFRDSLLPEQRDAFTAMLAMAAEQGGASGNDVQGYYWWEVLPALWDQFLKSPIGRPIDINAMVEQMGKG